MRHCESPTLRMKRPRAPAASETMNVTRQAMPTATMTATAMTTSGEERQMRGRRIDDNRAQMKPRVVTALGYALTCALMGLFSASAFAAVPGTIGLEARLESQAGGPVADGSYEVTLSLYPDAKAAAAVYSETGKASVKAGRFAWALGSVKPLPAAMVDASKGAWLGIKVGKEPELSRVPLRAVAFAVRAGVADSAAKAMDLACSGCVSVAELKFDGDLDLGGNSIKAKNGTFTGALLAATVTANSLAGDGSKLTNVQIAGGACKAGQVVTAVKADGSVTCGPGGGGGDVLGGKLTDVFTESAADTSLPLSIPDNTGVEAVGKTAFGDVGSALDMNVRVALANTDLSVLRITLVPPATVGKPVVLCDPCGPKNAKAFDQTFTASSKLKSGSLADFVGKPLKGTWVVKVLDYAFCLTQLPGNAALCQATKKLDGTLNAFSVSAKVKSSQSIGTASTFQVGLYAAPPFACVPSKKGHMYYDTKGNTMRFCNGSTWGSITYFGCGNNKLEPGEQCDDGNTKDGDGCTAQCTTICGDGKKVGNEQCDDGNTKDGDGCSAKCELDIGLSANSPAKSCAEALKAGLTKDGEYWLKWGTMTSSMKVWCDQNSTFGTDKKGGWMLYCGKNKASIAGTTCGTGISWEKMKDVDYRAHVQMSPNNGWWMSIESNLRITSTPKTCNARIRVKSDIGGNGGWGKTDSGWMNNLNAGTPCGGNGGCWWGYQSSCNSGGIHLRSNGNGYTSVDTMANGWVQITHGGGLGALGGYSGGKHTSFGAGGTHGSASDWMGYVR